MSAAAGPKVAFFASPAFALPVLEALRAEFEVVLVVAQPDKPVGRGLKLTPPPVAARAAELGLPLAQPHKLRGNADFAAQLRDSGADVAVTCAYGKILPAGVLEIPRFGFLNTHTSLLPRYRGAAPIQWALIRGETVTGTTIMQTDEGMDTGPVLLQEELPIRPEWTSVELSAALSEQAAALIVRALRTLETLTPQPQDEAQATHAPLLVKEDGFVRWADPAQAVLDRFRGVAAWPQTTAFFGGKRLKLAGLTLGQGKGQPGKVLQVGAGGLTVACGEGAVCIATVQPEAKKAQPAQVWAQGQNVEQGARFDLWEPPQG
ncbi:methionyl-tRNA formyltransferase [Deinococcus radiodurans]|uniref:Methionyl-tRNA formyltransferase n=1 Tax=Deinococcus radiodurans (strain ATCC 13939 / DSM 20539 / JCM 16871 / CCUG 27074 / LMG 4051 / NBRC 15346 / NCIMB 9279 / VKM B-1422 / R1) TaxID=243230 RepID=FMT_DEIRA|nr:methionyl-tRNA formyltransferase [Deinococcus radiodurans]Q9RRQ3.1 RecName: Full=Methionyl-tRNA formyltransferase [Deinococcus radiodurans R1 = ATCC 13939 = DSM 20539]AAF11976.1 methionyl-tRNA formyltransferase [Deinococcus radiodurans R1 = ATCC 13939 = DSM 20539]ANC70528.1 methionyl-tRNA formyltransferase [Deinococcus radiodurans R1 = ATCC 13939 = DSM 20539]QEM71807.1 methionyl-tRNA formyltransferase [Deinococcus radiodurans]QIP28090.1 methionyl-tRNA formyltransferase [Deinococcus radiodur